MKSVGEILPISVHGHVAKSSPHSEVAISLGMIRVS
jgi:hypothetical protein